MQSSNKYNTNKFKHNKQSYLNDIVLKKHIIKFLYSSINFYEYKYKKLQIMDDLTSNIKSDDYYICQNINGIRSLLIFIKIDNKYICCSIDKKFIPFNETNVDFNMLIIHLYDNIKVNDTFYNGTVFEVTSINALSTHIIMDVYMLEGKTFINHNFKEKLILTNKKLKNNSNLIVNNVYDLYEIENIINLYIEKSKYSKFVNGLIFYRKYKNYNLLYKFIFFFSCNNNNNNQIIENKPIKDEIKYTVDTNNILCFRVKQTERPDVYNLYLIYNKTNTDITYKKIDIAYIPTLELSIYLRKLFTDNETNILYLQCKYNNNKNKWSPLMNYQPGFICNNVQLQN